MLDCGRVQAVATLRPRANTGHSRKRSGITELGRQLTVSFGRLESPSRHSPPHGQVAFLDPNQPSEARYRTSLPGGDERTFTATAPVVAPDHYRYTTSLLPKGVRCGDEAFVGWHPP